MNGREDFMQPTFLGGKGPESYVASKSHFR